MPTPKIDQNYIETALPELKNYLLSDILFYPLMGQLPRLTIGGLLLAQRRLWAGNLGTHLDPKLATLRDKWRAAWEKKSARELDARLTLWRNYLNDYRADPENYAADYKHEVRWRVIIELLLAEVDQIPAEIIALDELLRVKFIKGKFLWDKNLQSQFAQDKFWFLYGKLPG